MAAPYVFTFADALDSLEYFARGSGIGADQTLRRQAIHAAYREITQARDWTFLQANARIELQAAYTTGTVEYDETGGTNERQVTLTSGTWPSWAEDASIRFASPDIVCDVEERKSDTVLTLDATMAPIADISSGASYKLYPRWYRLPNDFLSMARPMGEDDWFIGEEVSKERIEQLNRYEDDEGAIQFYAVGAPLDLHGAMALYIHPRADANETLDIPINRRPRDLRYSGHDSADSDGTISVTAGSASVTGTSTAFDSAMVGSILRIGTDTTYKPTGLDGQYQYGEQRVIHTRTSATAITLDAAVSTTRSSVKYRISDPIDLDVSVYDAFLRCCEKHLARALRAKDYRTVEKAYEEALFNAKQGDHRTTNPRIAGPSRRFFTRLSDATSRETVE
jgi:hypothetical protein